MIVDDDVSIDNDDEWIPEASNRITANMQGNSEIKLMQIVVMIPIPGPVERVIYGEAENDDDVKKDEFENRARDIRSQDSSVTDLTVRSQAYHEVTQHLPDITESICVRKSSR
ncbi:hypothetical protein C1646_766330 [Rhizophagus diaphanus]|nr:hypothetical protein C1646_766330 [Rhizophagus diaphanus] [Rhizophagus sp. MUCL 43196]